MGRCEALSVPVRTLRSWLEKARSRPARITPPPKPKPKHDSRRGHVRSDVVLPGTVKASDTTSITVLGVELMTLQDVGGRDVNLLDGVLVAPTETSEMAASLMSKCLAGQARAQMVTDQGTRYMATSTVETLDALEVEHAIW